MKWLFAPLLLMIARSTESELAKQVEFLKAENQMLRRRIPRQVRLNHEERRLLVKLGQGLGKAVKALITVNHYRSYQTWVKLYDPENAPPPSGRVNKGGRPRKSDEVRALVLRLARENK